MTLMPNESDNIRAGRDILRRHWIEQTPLVAVWGQTLGWSASYPDPILERSFKHTAREGNTWKTLLNNIALSDDFYHWLAERFLHRAASKFTIEASRAPWCAIFTSSIDNGLANCLAGNGREPEIILRGNPAPRFLRNSRRPPFYYLFGQSGQHLASLAPPSSRQALRIRSSQHANPMLRRLFETVTPMGLIVIDGYDHNNDWLKADQLLAEISESPIEGVLWCGQEPDFSDDEKFLYDELVEKRIIIRSPETIGEIVNELIQSNSVPEVLNWDDPEVVTLKNGRIVRTTPNLRLMTKASATLIDDSWAGILDPLSKIETDVAFEVFHSTSSSFRAITEGVRRGFAIERGFEGLLCKKVEQALEQHHTASSIILHGQSGVGKTIALARLAVYAKNKGYAVLFINRQIPQASDLSTFLAEVDHEDGVTLLLVDTMSAASRYDELLRSLRSVGHRVVVVGSSYRLELDGKIQSRFIEAKALLDKDEQDKLIKLAGIFIPKSVNNIKRETSNQYVLAGFYRLVPSSRGSLSAGLIREVDSTRIGLRNRSKLTTTVQLGSVAQALINAGYPANNLTHEMKGDKNILEESTEAKAIDLVMISSRLFKAVPLSIVLRAISTDEKIYGSFNIDKMLSLIRNQDLFRWIYADEQQTDILVEARLQIEARLICENRFGSAKREADALCCLILAATRAGSESNDETSYIADLVHAVGPDGPEGERYSESYASIARALTKLRELTGMPNARLMLQESVLRRHYLRTQKSIDQSQKIELLDEAVTVVDEALNRINDNGNNGIVASLKTIDNLWNERAATYGYVATDKVQNGQNGVAYAAYKAAHEAAMLAKARRDSSFSIDVSLWIPIDILRQGQNLTEIQRLEISADLSSSIDSVDESMLDAVQWEKFQSRRMDAGSTIGDFSISDDAFKRLDEAGSTAGYFIRARELAPDMHVKNEPTEEDIVKAQSCVVYLRSNYEKIDKDERCLKLLLDMEWASRTKKWLMRGLRQPFPIDNTTRNVVKNIVGNLEALGEEKLATKYRYLRALTTWLEGNQKTSDRLWAELGTETQFADSQRVSVRHVLTDETGNPVMYRGVIEKQIGVGRYSVRVADFGMQIDCIASYFPNIDVSIGRVITNFVISFNYRGPLAEPFNGLRRVMQ